MALGTGKDLPPALTKHQTLTIHTSSGNESNGERVTVRGDVRHLFSGLQNYG